jgi:RNA polymerase sigma-70 factor, ECF subfamily
MRSNAEMPGRETTVASVPSDNATFDKEREAATAALHRDIEATLPKLRRYARCLARDVVAADDLVLECVARALAKLHLWRAGTDLRAWLFTILHNQYVSQLRRVTREGTTVEWSDCAPALTCAPQQIERLELRDLQRAIMSLSEEQRMAVLLVGLTRANYREIASACGVPVGTIRSRLSRGRAALRKLMGIALPQHPRASRPLRPAAAATAHQERGRPADCRSNIAQEVGDLPLERARRQDDSTSHTQADQHIRGNILDVNGHRDLQRQADLLEGRIDIRSGAWGWWGSEGSRFSDPLRTEPLLDGSA